MYIPSSVPLPYLIFFLSIVLYSTYESLSDLNPFV
nr:MAG TPA: hypothetical protein [Bacteriophage sp.]